MMTDEIKLHAKRRIAAVEDERFIQNIRGVKGRAFAAEVAPRVKPGALTRDVNTRLSAAEADPQAKPGAPAAAPAAVGYKVEE
jgi:hypothetical protein